MSSLFLGNGFSRSIFRDVSSWKGLFEATDNSINNYTFLYEAYRLNPEHIDQDENMVKAGLIQRITAAFRKRILRKIYVDIRNKR